jgi:hypothetical protein
VRRYRGNDVDAGRNLQLYFYFLVGCTNNGFQFLANGIDNNKMHLLVNR